MKPVPLSSKLIEAFAGTFLSPRYDDAKPTPQFHRDGWALYSSKSKQCAVIAPRDHAKSTSLTFDYILAEVCFRTSDYVILIGSTEAMAAEQLSNISEELETNTDLRREFGILKFEVEQKTEIIVVCSDGHRFRILARGAEQKIRGRMWKGKRPNLIVCDDMEDDEQVESKDRRVKFRRWFFRASKQALSKSGKIRVHGTILHEDSLLARLCKNKTWDILFYKAHTSYDDFSCLLWPERWSAFDLRERQREFEEDGDAAGYAQEFLNSPQDNADGYLLRENLLPMRDDDYDSLKKRAVGCDFAVSKKDMANRTSFTVGGLDLADDIHIEAQYVGRWGTDEWMDLMFEIDTRWNPEVWFVEGGVIWQAVYPMLVREMETRKHYLNFEILNPVKDKATRGRTFQKRTKVGKIRYDKKASWFPGYEDEVLKFTGVSEAKADDQFDSTATLCLGMDKMVFVEEDDFLGDEDQIANKYNRHLNRGSANSNARQSSTGY